MSALEEVEKYGFRISPQFKSELEKKQIPSDKDKSLLSYLLNFDIRETIAKSDDNLAYEVAPQSQQHCFLPYFPANVGTWAEGMLESEGGRPVVLQLASATYNIAAPLKRREYESSVSSSSSSTSRILSITLTDGHTKVSGIEYEHLPGFTANMPAGGKVLYRGGPVCHGKILLTPQNCTFIGGQVAHLLQAFNANNSAQKARQGIYSAGSSSSSSSCGSKVLSKGGLSSLVPPSFEFQLAKPKPVEKAKAKDSTERTKIDSLPKPLSATSNPSKKQGADAKGKEKKQMKMKKEGTGTSQMPPQPPPPPVSNTPTTLPVKQAKIHEQSLPPSPPPPTPPTSTLPSHSSSSVNFKDNNKAGNSKEGDGALKKGVGNKGDKAGKAGKGHKGGVSGDVSGNVNANVNANGDVKGNVKGGGRGKGGDGNDRRDPKRKDKGNDKGQGQGQRQGNQGVKWYVSDTSSLAVSDNAPPPPQSTQLLEKTESNVHNEQPSRMLVGAAPKAQIASFARDDHSANHNNEESSGDRGVRNLLGGSEGRHRGNRERDNEGNRRGGGRGRGRRGYFRSDDHGPSESSGNAGEGAVFTLEAEAFPDLAPVETKKNIHSSEVNSHPSSHASKSGATVSSISAAMANLLSPNPPSSSSYLVNSTDRPSGTSLADLPVSFATSNKGKNKGHGGKSHAQSQSQWSCKVCTFMNSPHLNTCEMCEKSR